MCGIFCTVFYNAPNIVSEDVKDRLKNRGPNYNSSIHFVHSQFEILFYGTVLWMQGPLMFPQPAESNSGILLFNGDIFDKNWTYDTSDTLQIVNLLNQNEQMNPSTRQEHIISTLKKCIGPFSLIYYDKINCNLYFTRDRIGRNSLLFHHNEATTIISSVLGRKYNSIEVPASHIHILNLKNNIISHHSWDGKLAESMPVKIWAEKVHSLQKLPDEQFTFELESFIDKEDDWIKYIQNASAEKCKFKFMEKLLQNSSINDTVTKLTELLEDSIKIRLNTQPNMCKNCLPLDDRECDHCTVGVLFSGGLDCTIIAFLLDKHMSNNRPIDLINVAFKKDPSGSYNVPDRQTGRQSFEELKKLRPLRKWVFWEVNVPLEELEHCQKTRIADLVHPRQTVLDESLGSALWFAARGRNEDSVSSCRVLLLGSGADELFGGYTRHRNAFKRFGWPGLNKELMLDWKRISVRNLARDNRVICDHGRQPRMPYLDEHFTNYVLQLKPWQRCFPAENIIIGDKLILRLLAFNLGLKEVCTFPKRALQFGSRIANKKEKGSDLSKNFLDSVE